jgi:hypothetical protein
MKWITDWAMKGNQSFRSEYSRTPLTRINWDGEPSGHAENPDNWIFLK